MVDNASTDGSSEMVEGSFPWVRLIRSPVNVGFARANNLALRQTNRDYVLLLNSDTEPPTGSIRLLITALEQRAELAAVSAQLILPDGALQPGACGAFPNAVTVANYAFFLSRFWPAIFPGFFMRQEDVARGRCTPDWICAACMLVRRQAIENVGMLQESFFMYAEDVEWCRRFLAKGWKVAVVSETSVIHHHGASTKRNKIKTPQWLEGLDRLLRSALPPWEVALVHAIHALGFGIRFTLYALAGRRSKATEMLGFMRTSSLLVVRPAPRIGASSEAPRAHARDDEH